VLASLLLAAAAAFLAGVLGGFTGFGISVVLVPLLLLAYDPATVVVLNGAISAAIAAAVARDSWRKADRPAALLLVPAAVAGKTVGTALFAKASQRAFRAAALGTVFLIAALGVATALRALL
jgi:uncharacterized protein